MKRVVTIGSCVLDVLLKSSNFKVAKSHEVEGGVAMCEVYGGKTEAQEALMASGGGASNVAVGLKKMGQAVKMITRLGNDEVAFFLKQLLEKDDLDLSLVQNGDGKTGMSAVLIAKDGGRSIVTYRGESAQIQENEIDWEVLGGAEWIQISSLGGEMDLLEDLVSFANSKDIGVGLNPGGGELKHRERMIALLPKLKMFNVNRMELCELTGISFDDEEKMVMKLAEQVSGNTTVFVTDGKRGAGVLKSRRWIKMNAFPNESVDDTGAGDGFVAGAVAGILHGKDELVCLKMGLANGGGVVGALGAKAGQLNSEEMEKWLRRNLDWAEMQL